MSANVARMNLGPLMDAVMDRSGKWEGREIRFRCPTPKHPDKHPSARYNPDKGVWRCDACGASGGYSDLANLLDVPLDKEWDPTQHTHRAPRRQHRTRTPPSIPQKVSPDSNAPPLPDRVQRRFWDAVQRTMTDGLPAALQGRGLDAFPGALPLARYAPRRRGTDDGLIGITNYAGQLVGIKHRADTTDKHRRYRWLCGGNGLPPWVSPCADAMGAVLVIEGPLNAMVAWLAVGTELGVVGMDSANRAASVPFNLLRGREIVIYADADQQGRKAEPRWAHTAHLAGASSVDLMAPLSEDRDFCDVAGRDGLPMLRYLLGVAS